MAVPCYWPKCQIDQTAKNFCNHILSSDALFALVMDRLASNKGCSIIRMADGEKACIDAVKGLLPIRKFLSDPQWLKEFGMLDTDIKKVGESLLWAAKNTTYLAIAIAGIYRDTYNLHQYFLGTRDQFIDQFYARHWLKTRKLVPLFGAAPAIIVHRYGKEVAAECEKLYNTGPIEYVNVNSWKDHKNAENIVAESNAHIVLVAAGPSGKAMCVRMAQRRENQVVLDVGHGLLSFIRKEKTWDPTSEKEQNNA